MAIEKKIVAQDAMTKIEKKTISFPCSVSELDEIFRPGREAASVAIEQLKKSIADMFIERDLPDPAANVSHKGGCTERYARFWAYFDPTNRPDTGPISKAYHYIEKSHEPLSNEAEWARIYVMAMKVAWAVRDQNIENLYYECIRLGSSIKQAQMRSAFLKTVEKKVTEVNANRSNSRKGGDAQSEKKKERYRVLNELATKDLNKFKFTSDIQARRNAKSLALKYDNDADAKLFMSAGKMLSNKWFDDWLAEFRSIIQKIDS